MNENLSLLLKCVFFALVVYVLWKSSSTDEERAFRARCKDLGGSIHRVDPHPVIACKLRDGRSFTMKDLEN